MRKKSLTINLETVQCVLTPISAEQYDDECDKSVPLFQDRYFCMVLFRELEWEETEFERSHLYVALKTLYGETTTSYDDYKCSFGYTFS